MTTRRGTEAATTRRSNGQVDPDAVNALLAGAEPIDAAPMPHRQAATTQRKPERFPLVTSAALDTADYTPRWIIDDILAAGSPAVDGGLFKTGKTLIAVDGSISVASGTPFLGRFEVSEPLSVVYFSGEGGPSVAQEYARRIAGSKGLALADVTNLFLLRKLVDWRRRSQKCRDRTAGVA